MFRGQPAVVPQNQGLFYITWLLAHPWAAPIPADYLAASVDDLFAWHQDFDHNLPWLWRHLDRENILARLAMEQQALEKILDDPKEPVVVKSEATRQLVEIYDLQRTIFTGTPRASQTISDLVFVSIYTVYATLAAARDFQGNPHPALRPFARHLFLYLLMPSIRTTGPSPVVIFTYNPPAGTTWSPWEKIPNL
jgi:hypothetical protein